MVASIFCHALITVKTGSETGEPKNGNRKMRNKIENEIEKKGESTK